MRIILLFIAFFSIPHLGEASINKAREVEPFLDIYKGKEQRDGTVKVSVTTNDKQGNLNLDHSSKIIEGSKYTTLVEWAGPVFKMEPAPKAGEEPRKGTAFHIGNNLVLTNQHVLDPTRKNLTQCGDFRVLNKDGKAYSCEKVLFCNNEHDICLIKMKPKKACSFLCGSGDEQLEIADGPAVKMHATYAPVGDQSKTVLTAIGNSMGLGIHVTQGLGVIVSPPSNTNVLWFYASVTKGNSGGPLLDDQGVMVGLIKQQSAVPKGIENPVGDLTYNIALRVEKVIELCRENLKNDPEMLGKFNQAVIE